MEREVKGITFGQLRDTLVEEGIEGVRRENYKPHEKEGAIEGFELVRDCEDEKELEDLVEERRQADHQAYVDSYEKKISIEEYWRTRWSSMQVEFCWGVVKAGMGIFPIYASHAMRYSQILSRCGARPNSPPESLEDPL